MDTEPRGGGGLTGAGLATIATFDEGRVGIERVELSPRKTGEIDLTTLAAAVCGSDLHTVLGHRPSPPRTALGHEGVGVVREADPGTRDLRGTPLRAGDRVVFMSEGQIVEVNEPDAFFDHPQSERAKDFLGKILTH